MANKFMKRIRKQEFRVLVLFLLVVIIALELLIFVYLADVQTQVKIYQTKIENMESMNKVNKEKEILGFGWQ